MKNDFLDEYKTEVISNILQASSQEEVRALVASSLTALERGDIKTEYIHKFVDMINLQLHWFSPMNKDAQQWSNIATAKVILYRWKQSYPDTTSNITRNV